MNMHTYYSAERKSKYTHFTVMLLARNSGMFSWEVNSLLTAFRLHTKSFNPLIGEDKSLMSASGHFPVRMGHLRVRSVHLEL